VKITSKGQVTIPRHIRERLGLLPDTGIEWELRDGEAVLRKAPRRSRPRGSALVEQMRGRGNVQLSTDEIIALMRGE
jgi:antitoxin PrlF